MSLPAKLLALVLLLVLAAGTGWRYGIKSESNRRDAADLVRERAAAEIRAESQRMANRAATGFETQRRAIEVRHASVSTDLRTALRAPIACPAAASAPLADLRIPAAVVSGLRRAGADPGTDRPATAEPRR